MKRRSFLNLGIPRNVLVIGTVLLGVLLLWFVLRPKSKPPARTSSSPGTSQPAPDAHSGDGSMDVYNDCGMEGDARNPAVKALNRLKNRYQAPTDAQIDHSITLERMFASGEDRNRFQVGQGAEIVGYVSDVKPGGVETCNCKTPDIALRDTHIELSLTPMNGESLPVIVEVTPRFRAMMKKEGVDWSTRGIREQFKGRWVKVRGWMMFDTEHQDEAENTNPGRSGNWRTTAWEVHPVTGMEVTSRPRPPVAMK